MGIAVDSDSFICGWDLGGAVAVLMHADWGIGMMAQGDAITVRAHVPVLIQAAALQTGRPLERLTVPRGAADVVPWVEVHGWNWMSTDVAPPLQAREGDVRLSTDDALIGRFLDEANPDASTRPGDPEIREWAVVPDPDDSGRLLASAAVVQWRSGARVLVSVATRPDARGQGLAAAVSAFLARRVIESGNGPLALGHYAENDTAKRVYERLGFITRSENMSGWLVERAPLH